MTGAAPASICFIAPVAQHRILFRLGNKEVIIQRANRFGIWGAVAPAVSMASAAALVMYFPDSSWRAAVAGGAVGLLCSWEWFAQPLLSRRRDRR